MELNFEVAQLLVGAAVLDRRFARTLLHERGEALRAVTALPTAPAGIRLSEEDRLLLAGIRAENVQEFARGVTRLCGEIGPVSLPAAAAEGAALSAGEDVFSGFAVAAAR